MFLAITIKIAYNYTATEFNLAAHNKTFLLYLFLK